MGPGLLDLLIVVALRKWFIVGMAFAGGLIAAVTAFLLPPSFTATTLIMPPQQQQSAASALLGQLGPMASLTGKDLGFKTPADLYIGILSGRTIADQIVANFGLRQVYQKKTTEETRIVLSKRTHFSTGKDSLIKISVDDTDAKRAAAIANAYSDALYGQTRRLALTEAGQRRLFFEQQLAAEKNALADSETALKSTQQRTGVFQVNSQAEATIRAIVQIRAEVASREVMLVSLKGGATDQNPAVVRQETELGALRQQLRTLESRGGTNRSDDPLITTSELPQAGLDYVRAVRDVKYHETLFELLSKQFEIAKIDEAKEAPLIQVIDAAVPPERKSWPPRALLTVAGAVAFGLLGCLWAFLQNRLQDPADTEKLRIFRRALFGRA